MAPGGINRAASRTAGASSRVIGKPANETTRSTANGLEKASKRHKELEDNYQSLTAKLAEIDVPGANQQDVKKATDELSVAETALNSSAAALNSSIGNVIEPPKPITNNAEILEPMVVIKDEPVGETDPGSLFVPQNTQPGTNATNPNGIRRSESADPDRGTTDFGRWTPADEDENNLFTPGHAREAAGLETEGKIVAWATRGNSKPVIVAYGPQNSRKYMRSTAYRESDFIDKDTKQFGPKHRFGDNKETGIREPHEFKGIIGVAYNCPVEELAPRAPRKKGDAPNPRKPGVDVWVEWEINGEVKRCWEVRSSLKIFRSFCDLYIYQAALHYEKQYNAWKANERKSADRSPTPAVTRLQSASPGLGADIKKESQAVPAPAIQITNTALSPIKQYREEWCDLQDIDPKKMTAEDGVNFKLAWDMFQLKVTA
ncbi:hypothetical protein V502_00823 [Pseudogymnoascus sp. VKM F-4520 (FW-2644)]|nr:hypothetical protein V502_00823 [Pseudogymnoascus sp. VKM F-4520 (FW-2644)]